MRFLSFATAVIALAAALPARADDTITILHINDLHSRLEPIKRVARMIQAHWEGVLNAATRNVTNVAGELLSGAETLAFSVGFLRDFGH